IPTNKGKNKVLIKDKKDNERESNQKEKTEEAFNLTYKAQTYLNTKEILSLKECGTMDYTLISDISKNAISKKKKDPDLLQEDANKQAPTLTESIIQNSKCSKEDTTVTSQQITEAFIVPLKNEHSTIKTKQEDIYSSQWAFTRDKIEVSQKPTLGFKSKVKPIQFITLWDLLKEARIGQIRSSKECSKPSKSFNLGSKPNYVDKENISQTDLLQEILERLNRLEISWSVELMDMDKTKLPASNLIQNAPYHDGIQ
ncbi:21298_t:CDS:2, partial [Gigaspora rosea]